jgi:uncharacterized membrane protein
MAVFHFCFDLNHFGWLSPRQNFYADPFWTWQRTCIVSLFLLCAGAGQALAVAQGQSWARFWRRWAQIAACALLVSAGSALMFPRSWISFGVLHGMAVMLVVCRLLAPAGWALWPLGALAVTAPQWGAHPMFNGPWLHWTGLVTVKPITEDWVPVLPWLGVMLWGMAGLQALQRWRPAWIHGGLPAPARPWGMGRLWHALAVLGRWSLSFYMLHQPILIGLLALSAWAITGRLPL